ncbi:hypothetical protein QBC44DRAFT_398310 [Cladorrhinum sp. PSN332]|nr:hypothetical protein QBC44DRAFT_398310 [Cladorrhinum sp. PSN332]
MTSFGPPPGFAPSASSSGDDGGGNSGGNSITTDRPWPWVLIPVAVLISLGAVAACLHTSRRRRRAAQLAHESSLSNRVLNGHPSSPHLSPRRLNRGRDRDRDLEAAYALSTTRSTRWWSLPPPARPPQPEEGLNELGEAPPPYEKARDSNAVVPPKKRGHRGVVEEMQELPPDNNQIAELDAGESSRPNRAVAVPIDGTVTPEEMDATPTTKTKTEAEDSESDEEDVDAVEYHQAYAVTITSGTASRTESPASWTRGDDSARSGGGLSNSRGTSVPPGYEHTGDGDDDHAYEVRVEEVREPPVAGLSQGGEQRGRKGV